MGLTKETVEQSLAEVVRIALNIGQQSILIPNSWYEHIHIGHVLGHRGIWMPTTILLDSGNIPIYDMEKELYCGDIYHRFTLII